MGVALRAHSRSGQSADGRCDGAGGATACVADLGPQRPTGEVPRARDVQLHAPKSKRAAAAVLGQLQHAVPPLRAARPG
eukprot:scaffold86114_cov74-Phaeocystis_antarctica.AAC.2